MADARGVVLETLTWVEAERWLTRAAVVVIPLGAAAKEHGPHLLLNNDLVLAQYLAEQVALKTPVVVAPPVNCHYYPAFREYPGSISLSADTARDVVADICRSLHVFGPHRFYVLNTGVSTALPLADAARMLAEEKISLRFTDWKAAVESAANPEQEGGSHADEIETSIMLHIKPQSVSMDRAVKEFDPLAEGPLSRSRRDDACFSPSGVWGDPTLASAAKGKRIVESLLIRILDEIEALRRVP